MNYIILNGVNSNTIKGLIIQELPPISKPNIRTSTTKIDGRDGDIIEYLGYDSYDKTVSIGLFGEFDINEIIKFFTGTGTVTFSNEPDKVYYFDINNQIDYERLIRFRTAKVKLHMQPFKYLLNEEKIEEVITSQTSIIVNNKGLEVSKPIIKLYGDGLVSISLNGLTAFKIIIDEYVTIDTFNEEAYKDNVYKNRDMVGEFPILEVGENIITWDGTLTKIEVTPNSRWL